MAWAICTTDNTGTAGELMRDAEAAEVGLPIESVPINGGYHAPHTAPDAPNPIGWTKYVSSPLQDLDTPGRTAYSVSPDPTERAEFVAYILANYPPSAERGLAVAAINAAAPSLPTGNWEPY
jgi:hypothetical protein